MSGAMSHWSRDPDGAHIYLAPGTYTVATEVTDGLGTVQTASSTVTVVR